MTYQITLSDHEDAALAAATKSGTEPEQLLHDMIQRLQPSSQGKRPLTARELAEKQYHEGKISHIPTRQSLTAEEREARERRAHRFAGGMSASEMVIEDRGHTNGPLLSRLFGHCEAVLSRARARVDRNASRSSPSA